MVRCGAAFVRPATISWNARVQVALLRLAGGRAIVAPRTTFRRSRSKRAPAAGVPSPRRSTNVSRATRRMSRSSCARLSFLKTYSAARTDPRRTTRATVSVVGPDGKIAMVASADMHKLNAGAMFFYSAVSSHKKRAARFSQHVPRQIPLSAVRPRYARTGDEVLRLKESQPPFRRWPTGRAVRRAYPARAPSACETRGSRRSRHEELVGDGAR